MPIRFLLKLLCVIVAFLFIATTPRKTFASHILFQDNFDDGNANGWEEHVGPGGSWNVTNGEYVGQVSFNPQDSSTYALAGDINWSNYILELQFKGTSGVDKKVKFRYKNSGEYYDLNLRSSPFNDLAVNKVGPSGWLQFVPLANSQNVWYKVKVVLNGFNIKIYIDDILKFDFTDNNQPILNGRIALEVWPGAATPTTINRFDNVVVTGIDDILPVPYFSQNALPWGPSEYDSASSLGIPNPTMDRWGCAVTSAAMILKYHGMTQLQDNTPLDPGTLNTWLKNNGGYLTGTGSDGGYSYLLWPAISKLTKQLFDAGKSPIKLEHQRAYPSAETTNLLNDDLLTKKIPDILQVKNALTSGHFVVAKGVQGEIYALNDPEWNYPTLASFNNNYFQVDRFIPSLTDLSYIVIVTNPGVELLVTDNQGRRTGKIFQDGQLQTYNQIPNATYAFESPISNPSAENMPENLGNAVHVLYLPKPVEGNYQLTTSSQTNQEYTLNTATFTTDGQESLDKTIQTVSPSTTDAFTINYSQTQPSLPTHVITFQSTINDINEAKTLGLISKASIAKRLINMIEGAASQTQRGNLAQALSKLNQFADLINKERGKTIMEEAYQILLKDVVQLKQNLQ